MLRVSVVVPLYNKEKYLLRTLNSIAAQTLTDFEVILVDDGSTDDGPSIARNFPDPRFRVIGQPNAGPGAARNRGIAEAQSDLVAFLDADDEWYPDYLETGVTALERHPNAVSHSRSYIEAPWYSSTEPMWRSRGITNGIHTAEGKTGTDLHYMLAFMSPWSTVARKAVVQRWGGFYEKRCKFGEDSFLWLKLLLNEQVEFELRPGIIVHREAGELSQNLKRARPIEPFLSEPEAIEAVCPPAILPELRHFFTLRAFKTACAWSVKGDWREAADVRRRFRSPGDYRVPFYFSSMVCATPVGPVLGKAWQLVDSLRKRSDAGTAEPLPASQHEAASRQ